MIQKLDYWHDGQQRRFLEQIVRAFSGFQYATGRRNGAEPVLRTVPCRMANRNRMVGNLMRNGSENTALACPLITVDQTGLTPRRQELQNVAHVDTQSVHERAIDEVTGRYTDQPGNRYTVRRLMPRPFEMTIQVDIWTSNMDQKHQLSEQILTVFFPDIQIQNSENAVDWGARTLLTMEDVTWTSQTLPMGGSGESDLEIFTMTFKLPIWLSPPVEVTRERIINQIITNIRDGEITDDPIEMVNTSVARATNVTTPGNHRLAVEKSPDGWKLKLLGPKGAERDDAGNVYQWADLFDSYDGFRLMETQVRLRRDLEGDDEIIGYIEPDPRAANEMFWQIDPDTLPANTLQPVNAVVNPLTHQPGYGLPAAQAGQRYLLLHDLSATQEWDNVAARENDIIQHHNGAWRVEFRSQERTTVEFIINLKSGTQLRWTGTEWQIAIGGDYGPGLWRLVV